MDVKYFYNNSKLNNKIPHTKATDQIDQLFDEIKLQIMSTVHGAGVNFQYTPPKNKQTKNHV